MWLTEENEAGLQVVSKVTRKIAVGIRTRWHASATRPAGPRTRHDERSVGWSYVWQWFEQNERFSLKIETGSMRRFLQHNGVQEGAGERGHWPPGLLNGGQRGWRCHFITASYVILWFIKIELKQIYCSYLRTQKIQNGFLIFEVNIVAEQKKHIGNDFFVFHKFPLP